MGGWGGGGGEGGEEGLEGEQRGVKIGKGLERGHGSVTKADEAMLRGRSSASHTVACMPTTPPRPTHTLAKAHSRPAVQAAALQVPPSLAGLPTTTHISKTQPKALSAAGSDLSAMLMLTQLSTMLANWSL